MTTVPTTNAVTVIPGTTTETPVLDSILLAKAYNLSWIYVLYIYVLTQSRIATATGVWLDRISYDFFQYKLPRLSNESDSSFRARILAEILRPRQTRLGITDALITLTDAAPKIIELWNTGDTYAYGVNGWMGYGQSGIYGSLLFRNQVLVTAYRPLTGEGIRFVPGYATPYCGYGASGYGEYAALTWVGGEVTDADIYATVAGIVAAGITAWTAIEDQVAPPGPTELYFGNIENSQMLGALFSYYW